MSEVKIYGIPNCDSVKKTFEWFRKNKIDFEFHNYKKDGIETSKLKKWCNLSDWKLLLNTKGTTWKKIADQFTNTKMNEKLAISVMLEHNSIIKRPVFEHNNKIIVGYDENELKSAFKK